ncbi:flagellar attachment zone protein 1-like isoform X2 [Ischnura elegans]|nr:flagellar attachment zone protein 1-like isoform X2 [Ischnura elegans]XP_046396862.1 flagellar attachment zone protein 1-like isoform X2 [Ischnura elegans]
MHEKIEILHEELRIAKDYERSERYKDNSMHNLLNQQQEIIDDLIGVKDDNIKLTTHNQELKNINKDLQEKLELMVKEHKEDVENLKEFHSSEIKKTKKESNDEVIAVKRELEQNQQEFHQRYKEIANKLEALKQERDEQVNILIAEYEGKLQKSNELLASATMENKNLRERVAANMSIYQKKLHELEKENSIASFRSYGADSSPIGQNMVGNFHRATKKPGRPLASASKYTPLTMDSRIQLPEVHSKEQRGIKKYLMSGQKHLGMIAEPLDSQVCSESHSEDEKEAQAFNPRQNVTFPMVKKKKLFTPGDDNLLRPM